MTETLSLETISTRQEKLVEMARKKPKMELTTLAHHIDEMWLREAWRRTRKDGAAGVDGVTAAQYETNLDANLTSLLERFKTGQYRAPAVRRVHIPKAGKPGQRRPIGIPTLEDKILLLDVLPKRFGRYGLTVHPEKTRLVAFRRPDSDRPEPESFDFLGFTHYWGRSRKGSWMVARKTAKSRFSAALKRVAQWCRKYRHQPVAEQHAALSRKLQGHYAYYGITGNAKALSRFRYEVERCWRLWLSRRSGHGNIVWQDFHRMLRRYHLPSPRVIHGVYRHAANP